MLSRFARIASKSNVRPFIGVSGFVGVGCGLFYLRKNYSENDQMLSNIAMATGVISGCVGLGIVYGPMVSARLMGIDRFIEEPRLRMKAISTMKDPAKAVNAKMYNKIPILKSRKKAAKIMINAIKSRMDTVRSLTITGMRETGKTTLMRDVATELSEMGYPTLYVEAQPDPKVFYADILSALGVDDDIIGDVRWLHIHKLLKLVCGDIDGPNVVIIDGVNRDLPYLDDIQSLQRKLSEEYPQTVIVFLTADSTDLLYLKKGGRRDIHTIWPFEDESMTEYLKVCGVQPADIEQALEIINQQYSYSLIKIEEMIKSCLTLKDGRIDFDAIGDYIQNEEAKLIRKIRGEICGMNQETMQKLKSFVESKGGKPFGTNEWIQVFGHFSKEDSAGFKLLKDNQLLWIADEELFVFHNAMTRNCMKKIV